MGKLNDIRQKLSAGSTTSQLIEQGYLVPGRMFCPDLPDMTGIATQQGDFNQKQLGIKMDEMELIGNLVDTWKQFGENRSSLYFATNVKHSKNIAGKPSCKAPIPCSGRYS